MTRNNVLSSLITLAVGLCMSMLVLLTVADEALLVRLGAIGGILVLLYQTFMLADAILYS